MIDNKKIEEAASTYGTSNDYSCIGPDGRMSLKPELETAFETGARWAINEFSKDLWHQVNKEPEGYDEWILLHYSVGNYYSLAQVKEFKSWEGFVEKIPIDGWLYIDDLFAKEGGEQ